MRELRNGRRDYTEQVFQPSSAEHEYLTVVETAMKARLSPKTLYNWISMGRSPAAREFITPGERS